MVDIVFNENSLSYNTNINLENARPSFERFVAAIAALIDGGFASSILRTQHCIQDAIISTIEGVAWSIGEWLCDQNVDRDLRLFVLSLNTKIPFEDGVSFSDDDIEALITYEYRAKSEDGPHCYSIGFAHHTGDIVASIPSNPIWDDCPLAAQVCSDGRAIKAIVVDHVSCDAHCSELASLIETRLYRSISTPAELRINKEELFPNLQFSPDINDQIDQLDFRSVSNVLDKLKKMDETAKGWRESDLAAPAYSFRWRGESQSTMDNPQLRQARIFRLPSGANAVFENHLDFSDRHRIHYIEDRQNRTFVIGYIGNHLPTVLFPH